MPSEAETSKEALPPTLAEVLVGCLLIFNGKLTEKVAASEELSPSPSVAVKVITSVPIKPDAAVILAFLAGLIDTVILVPPVASQVIWLSGVLSSQT